LTRVPPEAFVEAIYGGIERAIEAMGIKPRLRMDQIPGFTVAQIVEASLYLQRVAACIDERMREGQWKCVECGQVVWAKIDLTATAKDALTMEVRHVRRDAHYCSQACRAKAFRKRKRKGKRVTAKASDTAAKPSRVTALASRRAA
jgi:ferredoxin